VPLASWWAWLDGATPFQGLTPEERQSIVDHMLAKEILAVQEGRFWLGPEGEKTFGRANFSELYAVFSTPRLFTVLNNREEVGTVDAQFLQAVETGSPDKAAFVLAGRPWRIVHVDWPRGVCTVKPADDARAPRWSGSPRFLSFDLMQKIRALLLSDDVDDAWSARARETIAGLRAEHGFLRELGPAPLIEGAREITWWTHAGGRANSLLARLIEAELGGKCVVRNESLTCKEKAGESGAALRTLLHDLARDGRPNLEDARRLAPEASRVSKFESCLPPALLAELVADDVFDVEAARSIVRSATAVVGA
jgi:ATP-dependent Lhr-like helicase